MIARIVRGGYGAVVVCTALLLVSCDGRVNAPGSSTATPDETEAPTSAGPSEAGVAISKSDVSGIQDSPISRGTVLFIPDEREGDLGDTAGIDPSDPGQSRHTSFELDESSISRMDGAVSDIQEEGRFSVDVRAGDYFICLSDAFSGHSPGPPYSVVGCDLATIDDDDEVTVSHGEGGVEARPD